MKSPIGKRNSEEKNNNKKKTKANVFLALTQPAERKALARDPMLWLTLAEPTTGSEGTVSVERDAMPDPTTFELPSSGGVAATGPMDVKIDKEGTNGGKVSARDALADPTTATGPEGERTQ